jgi:hydroxypyruvate isomerase
MDRRHFLASGLAAAGAAALPADGFAIGSVALARPDFKLHYAPHLGQFEAHAGPDPVDQIRFMAEQGFTAFEDNGMRERPVAEQQRIADALQAQGMRMGVFVAHTIPWSEPRLTSGDPAQRAAFLDEIRSSVEVAQRVNATWMTVVPGHVHPRLAMDYQTAHVIDALREAAAILEPHDLVMVLEPLNTLTDHPGMFLTESPQAYALCRAVDSSACKILFDCYHQQITEGNLIPNIDAAWDEIAYIQVGDNPGRNEPTTGEINYRSVFRHLHDKGYDGIVGMEHGQSQPGRAGEQSVIDAYVTSDTS